MSAAGSTPDADGSTGDVDFSWAGLRRGFVGALPVALGVGGYGVVFGVLAREAGLGVTTAVAMSATVLAGAAQLVAVGVWDWPVPVVAVVGATLVVNLRYLLMGAALRPWLARLPPGRAYASLFFMADENWALTVEDLRSGSGRGAFLLGSGLAIWVCWVAATAVGAVAGGAVGRPETYGLDFVLTAIFAALLVEFWDGRSRLVPWLAAAAAAVVVDATVPGRWDVLAGGVAASLAEVSRRD